MPKVEQTKKVILAENPWLAMFSIAAREGLLEGNENEIEDYAAERYGKLEMQVLPLLVLFDEILIPFLTNSSCTVSIPLLESAGLFTRIPDTLANTVSLTSTGWGLRRDWSELSNMLSRTLPWLPLIVDRMVSNDDPFWDKIKTRASIRRDQFYEGLIRYAIAFYSGDTDEMRCNTLSLVLEPNVMAEIDRELALRNRPFLEMTIVDLVLLGAITHLDHLEFAQRASAAHGAPVATTTFGDTAFGDSHSGEPPLDSADTFCLVRSALFEGDGCFPHIESIRHALKLRRDPNIDAVRKQVGHYQALLQAGQIVDAQSVQKDVKRALEILAQSQSCKAPLDWINYASVPTGLLNAAIANEPLLSAILIAVNLGLSGLSTAATYTTNQDHEDNRWVLLGR